MSSRHSRARARRREQQTEQLPDDPTFGWMFVGDRRMFAVGYTEGGAPYGCYEDEFEVEPEEEGCR